MSCILKTVLKNAAKVAKVVAMSQYITIAATITSLFNPAVPAKTLAFL